MAAKTKITPKGSFKLTIPKLELQAAELLSKLIDKVTNSLKISKSEVVAFSDSEVALAWMKGDLNRWTPFVQNRVRKITKVISRENWKYCPTKLNPANLATRGIFAKKLITNKLLFLLGAGVMLDEAAFLTEMKNVSPADMPEQRKSICLLQCGKAEACHHPIIAKFSSFNRLIRVFGYVMQFVKIVRDRKIKTIRRAMNQSVTRSKEIISFPQIT